MCAAGQVDQAAEPIIETPSYEADHLESLIYTATPPILIRSILPRGPPVR